MSKAKSFAMAKAKEWKDKLDGGKADKKKPSDFDKQALAQGTKVESEHTKDKKLAMEIAMDHLTEDPKYYEKLKQVEKAKSATSNVDCGTGLAGKICAHNKKKLNKSEGNTYGYKNSQATVNTTAQRNAEDTVSPELLQYINASLNAELSKIRLAKGTVTVHKKEEGLYSGFFEDNSGQVVEEFANVTPAMIAKTLMVKGYYDAPILAAQPEQPHSDEQEDRELIREKINDHIAMFHQGQAPGEAISGKGYVRIKYGNFELEIKKSMSDFVKAYRNEQPTKDDVKKALNSWRRNSKAASQFRNDVDAAQALITDWNQYGEDFSQILYAMKMKNEK